MGKRVMCATTSDRGVAQGSAPTQFNGLRHCATTTTPKGVGGVVAHRGGVLTVAAGVAHDPVPIAAIFGRGGFGGVGLPFLSPENSGGKHDR